MTSAKDWRQQTVNWSRAFSQTSNGGPPPGLIESVINLESGGDPNAYANQAGGGSVGLGQIATVGLGYGGISDFMADGQSWRGQSQSPENFGKYSVALAASNVGGPGLEPDDRYDPNVNIGIATYELDTRQAMGGFYDNWIGATVGYFGAASTEGWNGNVDSNNGTTGQQYYDTIRRYGVEQFGEAEVAKWERGQGGSGTVGGNPLGSIGDKVGDAAGAVGGAVADATGITAIKQVLSQVAGIADLIRNTMDYLVKGAPRVALFGVGLAIVAIGTIAVLRS